MLFDNNPRKCKYPEADVYRFTIIANTYPTVYHFAFKYITFKLLGKINHFMSLNNEKLLIYIAKMTNLQNYALTCTTEPVEFFYMSRGQRKCYNKA
ncbi:hypothetical protein T08_10036 [Trichinella sp. T8]|nr:hypothetical protein T08_10036 [Trichinella sp. T8]